MATDKLLKPDGKGAYVGPAINTTVDISSTGIKYVDWSALASPAVVDGYTFRCWTFGTSTYRFTVLGLGGSDRLYYYVVNTHSSPYGIYAYPHYYKN